MTGGRPSRGARSGVASGGLGTGVRRASSSGRGVGSVLSCRPPSCRSSSVGPPGPRVRHRAGAARDAEEESPAQRARARLAVPMLESLAAGAVGGTQQAHPGRRQTGRVAEHLQPGRAGAGRARCPPPSTRRASRRRRVCSGPARSPKRVEAVRVTVPPTLWWAAPASVEGVGQPAPGDLGEHRVVDQLLVGLRREVADAAGRAVPGLVPVGVEQHDEPRAGDLDVVVPVVGLGDPRADGVRPRREPLRRGDVLEDDLGPGPDAGQRVEGGAERGGGFVPARVPASVPGARPGWWAPRAQGRPPDSTPRPTRRTVPRRRVAERRRTGSPGVWEDGQS